MSFLSHYQACLLRSPLQICNSREAALSAFHFQRMQLGLSNTLKIEHAQSIPVQFHSGNLASLGNLCSSITIKTGQRKKHLHWSSCVWPHLEGPQSDLQASAKGKQRETEFSDPRWYLEITWQIQCTISQSSRQRVFRRGCWGTSIQS